MKKTFVRFSIILMIAAMMLSMASCDAVRDLIDGGDSQEAPECAHDNVFDGRCVDCDEIFITTIAEAKELCPEDGSHTSQLYYLRATVSSVTNASTGAMIIEDSTGSISVNACYDKDGLAYNTMSEKPDDCDKILLHCILENVNGSVCVKTAFVIEFEAVEAVVETPDYTEMTIAEAREAESGTNVRVSGVVARITYAFGMKPSGVVLVDNSGSIYVYGGELATQVSIGNSVEITATKTYWVLADEQTNAAKFGYKGANQLENATVISNDKSTTPYDKSWITETTVKEIIETPVSEDITGKIYKVNALVKKAPGQGFVNYYIDDIDGATGSYVYTQCNGGDFGWLDEFDGKICTVYLMAINAKSTSSGCVWRFLPVEVIDEGYVFDTEGAAEYAVKYHGADQFLSSYTGDPAIELLTTVSSELLGFEGATLSYSSDNEAVVYFTTEDGVTTFHCGESGKANITVTGSYNGKDYSETLTVSVSEATAFEYITVSEAIAAENNTAVTVHGIVGPSLANQTGFYLIDESGIIAVRVAKTEFDGLEIGHEIIVTGTRTVTKDGGGQICIDSATVVRNVYGDNDYSTETFITGKTVADICALEDSAEQTTSVYIVTATVSRVVESYSTKTYLVDGDNQFMLYAGGPGNYAWLDDYNGKTVTVEVAVCDWNAKGLKGCVLAVYTEDGSKVYNALNFQ